MNPLEQITIGQLLIGLTFIIGLVAAIQNMKKNLREALDKLLKDRFDKIDENQKQLSQELKTNQESLSKEIRKVSMENCKNYLVTFISEAARGEIKDEVETQRFWEEYEYYIKNGGNSYVKERVEQLKAKNKLS